VGVGGGGGGGGGGACMEGGSEHGAHLSLDTAAIGTEASRATA